MRRLVPLALALLFAAAPLSGCYSLATPNGPIGSIYTDTSGPLMVTSNGESTKMGRSESTAIFGFAFGDASVAEAQRNGGISTIHHVDYEVTSVLGLYVKYATIVYGE